MDTEPIILPPGLYDAKALEVERFESRSGRRMWRVHFQIEDTPFAGASVWSYLLGPEDSDKARWVWEEAVSHPLDLIVDDEVLLDVRNDVWQDEIRNKVAKILPRVS